MEESELIYQNKYGTKALKKTKHEREKNQKHVFINSYANKQYILFFFLLITFRTGYGLVSF
jgi:hypothetical protein